MKKILAMIIDPNAKRVLRMEKIENSLESLQSIVGGRIENSFRFETGMVYSMESGIYSHDLYTDEEAKLKDFDCGFIVVDEEGNQLSPLLAGKGVIVGADIEGDTVSADPNELIKSVKVQTIKKGDLNWENFEEAINHEIARGAVWSR